MEDILNLLTESGIINDYEILSLLQDEDFYYLKIKSYVIDRNVLHIKIYLSDTEYNYSFHWQRENGELNIRWDNSPHHHQVETFPHHMHTFPMNIQGSYGITLNDVLKEIKKRLQG